MAAAAEKAAEPSSSTAALVADGAADGPSQTHAMPSVSGAALRSRVEALWNAIVRDDPDSAMPFFFPRIAYEHVKDLADADADWKHRLVAAYRRDIHALHTKLGEDAGRARFVSFDVPDRRARWVEPGEEWNKLGYYRVFGSKLRYSVDGEEHHFDVRSLISWRGEWFVVHLSAIK